MNFKLTDFASEPLVKMGDEEANVVTLDWVSHGNYAIHGKNIDYIGLEQQHFQEIVNAYEGAPKPSGRTPFWTGTVPPRGLGMFEYTIEAYAYNDKHVKLIQSTCSAVFSHGAVPHYHAQTVIEIETIRAMTKEIDRRKQL